MARKKSSTVRAMIDATEPNTPAFKRVPITPQYGVELRIGHGPWYSTGVLCESSESAESVGAMLAKFWLGVASSRVVKQESNDGIEIRESHHELVESRAAALA